MMRFLWVLVFCVVQCLGMSRDELEDFSNFLLKTSSLDIHVKKGADPDGLFDEDEVVSDHAWEDSGKFEGDLILNDRQRRLIVETVEGLSRNGLTDSTKRWPDNEVIYFIQREHFSSGQVQAIQDGIDDLGRASCVKFRPYRKGDRDAVVIQGSRRGCFSQVGYQGGYQVLNLSGRHPVGRGCFRHGTVVHELLHTLGFYHMQSSPDRDDYINVVWSNIVQPARHNFRKYNSFSVSDFGVGYDYDSVLHYSRKAFSSNGQDTLVPKKHGAEIGQRVGLSDKDTQKLNKMYCDADNENIFADEATPIKPKNKKKPKNLPFEGHGIGYHQGKTVVIKLPAAETYKFGNVPSTDMFDFSQSPQIVSTPEAEGYRFGKEVTYPYLLISPKKETVMDYQNSHEIKLTPNFMTGQQIVNKTGEYPNEHIDVHSSSLHSKGTNGIKPAYVPIDDYDKNLNDAFDRLSKIVKERVYPQNQDYNLRINKDYSKFYTPLKTSKSEQLDDTYENKNEPFTYDLSTPIIRKQKDERQDKIETFENLDENLRNRQLDDRMDYSFRTSLPTKKPYSMYEQTETPHYATLEYLKNRNDFKNLYSPETTKVNDYNDESFSTTADSQGYIKINPHDQGFYTDYVTGDNRSSSKDTSIEENSKEIKPSKYQQGDAIEQSKPIDKMDSSYRTVLPIKKPFSAYEHTETPEYATLEYLKNRHDISSLYKQKKMVDDQRKESYVLLGDEAVSTERAWYNKDSYNNNPSHYNQDSYSDYIQTNSKEENEPKSPKTDRSSFYDENQNRTPNQSQYHNKKYDNDHYKDSERENNEHRDTYNFRPYDSSIKKHNRDSNNDRGYYSDHSNEDEGHIANDDDKYKESRSYNRVKQKPAEYNHEYNPDYDQQAHRRISEFANENTEMSSEESPTKNKSNAMYSIPVPLTENWYRPSYSVPGLPNDAYNSRSNEDENR